MMQYLLNTKLLFIIILFSLFQNFDVVHTNTIYIFSQIYVYIIKIMMYFLKYAYELKKHYLFEICTTIFLIISLIIFKNILTALKSIKIIIITNLIYIFTTIYSLHLLSETIKNNSNYITIFIGIFTALITFITIILVYYEQKKVTKLNELSTALFNINENIETILQQLRKINIQYLSLDDSYNTLRLNMSRYTDLYTTNHKNLSFTNMLSNLNIFILSNIFISLYFSIFLTAIPIKSIYNIFPIFSTGCIILSIAFINYREFKDNQAFLELPSPNILLTPDHVLDITLCRKYLIHPYLPLKLFYVGVRIIVELNDDKFKQLLQKKHIKYYPENHMKMMLLFKYNINFNKTRIFYKADLGTSNNFFTTLYPKTFNLMPTTYTSYEYKIYIVPGYKIYMPDIDNINNDNIYIDITDSTNTTQYLTYYIYKPMSSNGYQIYRPVTIPYFEPNKAENINAEDLNFDRYHY